MNISGVRLGGSLPRTEGLNGLPSIQDELTSEPSKMHVAVIVFDVASTKVDTDSGDAIPTIRVRRVEPIGRSDDRKQLERLVMRAFEERTGTTVLPLELEDELRAAFGETDN